MQNSRQLHGFLASVLPREFWSSRQQRKWTADDFIQDVCIGLGRAPMSIRLTPHILSLIDWHNPIEDPLRAQFIPLGSMAQEDHPKLRLDSLSEGDDSPVKGLVHRYPDKALFLGVSLQSPCPHMLTNSNSKFSMSSVLPFLYPVILCWG